MKVQRTLDNMHETAKQRSSIYGFLARVYREEVTESLLNQIKDQSFFSVLTGMGADFGQDFLKNNGSDMVEALAVEFTRLFLGPGRHISPHESMHHNRDDGDWGKLWGASTVEVKKFIETAGLHYRSEYKGLPDHISVELEFMGELAKEEASAWEKNDEERARYCRQIQRKFMDWHMAQWIPSFCDKVIAGAELPFYREMAKITKSFLDFEKEELKNITS